MLYIVLDQIDRLGKGFHTRYIAYCLFVRHSLKLYIPLRKLYIQLKMRRLHMMIGTHCIEFLINKIQKDSYCTRLIGRLHTNCTRSHIAGKNPMLNYILMDKQSTLRYNLSAEYM